MPLGGRPGNRASAFGAPEGRPADVGGRRKGGPRNWGLRAEGHSVSTVMDTLADESLAASRGFDSVLWSHWKGRRTDLPGRFAFPALVANGVWSTRPMAHALISNAPALDALEREGATWPGLSLAVSGDRWSTLATIAFRDEHGHCLLRTSSSYMECCRWVGQVRRAHDFESLSRGLALRAGRAPSAQWASSPRDGQGRPDAACPSCSFVLECAALAQIRVEQFCPLLRVQEHVERASRRHSRCANQEFVRRNPSASV